MNCSAGQLHPPVVGNGDGTVAEVVQVAGVTNVATPRLRDMNGRVDETAVRAELRDELRAGPTHFFGGAINEITCRSFRR